MCGTEKRYFDLEMPEAQLASAPGNVRLLMFVEGVRYDEATLLMSVQQSSDDAVAVLPRRAVVGRQTEGPVECVPAKMFQTEARWGALLGVTGDGGSEEFIFVTSDLVVVPQILQRTSAACFARAFASSSCVRWPAAQKFEFRMRMATSDRYAAQFAGERMHQRQHAPEFERLNLGCEVHMSTGAVAKSLLLTDTEVQSAIRLALSLRLGGWMRLFRKALRAEVDATLEIRPGHCSEEAAFHRRVACTMFTGAGARRRLIQSLLHALPNGDWRDHGVVEVFVSDPSEVNREDVVQLVTRGLRATLANSQFLVFNRKRWTHNDDAICRLGLMEVCHGLLSRTYRRWLSMVGHKMAITSSAGSACADIVPASGCGDPLPLPDCDRTLAQPSSSSGGGRPVATAPQEEAAEAVAPPQRDSDEVDFAAMNHLNRALAARWVANGPLQGLVILRVVMEPSAALLRRQREIGSERWDREQLLQGLGAEASEDAPRSFRLVLAAQGELEHQFSEHQRVLFESSRVWSLLPDRSFSELTQTLIFRMVSRIGAEMERLICRPHRRAPFLLFLALVEPQVASDLVELYEKQPCLLDRFTLAFLQVFDPRAPDGKAAITLVCLLGHTDTARIECWHAFARRLVVKLGAQSRRPDFRDIAARAAAQRCKHRQQQSQSTGASEQVPAASALATEETQRSKKSRTGAGGEWRAFTSRRLRDGQSMSGAGQAYKSRTPEEAEHDRAEGAKATALARTGLPAFGPTKRQQSREHITNLAVAFDRQHGRVDDSFLERPASAAALAGVRALAPKSYEELCRIVRKAERLVSTAREAEEAKRSNALQVFVQGPGRQRLLGLAGRAGLGELVDSLHLLPFCAHDGVGRSSHLRFSSARAREAASAISSTSAYPPSFAGALDASWGFVCRPVYEEDWHGPEAAADMETPCWRAGVCICSARGKSLFKFRNRLLAALKRLCPRGTREHDALCDGHVVLRLRGKPMANKGVADWFGDSDDEQLRESDVETLFWHVSLLVLSPFVPVFQPMDCPALGHLGVAGLDDLPSVSLEAPARWGVPIQGAGAFEAYDLFYLCFPSAMSPPHPQVNCQRPRPEGNAMFCGGTEQRSHIHTNTRPPALLRWTMMPARRWILSARCGACACSSCAPGRRCRSVGSPSP